MSQVVLSQETENEIERVFRDLEFFEARINLPETIVVDGISLKETPRKRMNKTASINT